MPPLLSAPVFDPRTTLEEQQAYHLRELVRLNRAIRLNEERSQPCPTIRHGGRVKPRKLVDTTGLMNTTQAAAYLGLPTRQSVLNLDNRCAAPALTADAITSSRQRYYKKETLDKFIKANNAFADAGNLIMRVGRGR